MKRLALALLVLLVLGSFTFHVSAQTDPKKCMATAVDPKDKPGKPTRMGFAEAPTIDIAKEKALADCNNYGGKPASCVVRTTSCR